MLPQPSLPPHNGFGSQEDSKQNCVMLVPKPPKKDFLKLMNKDQIVLRFSAKLYPTERFRPSGDDAARTFVVTYFMADDTIAIFEKPLKNSGNVQLFMWVCMRSIDSIRRTCGRQVFGTRKDSEARF